MARAPSRGPISPPPRTFKAVLETKVGLRAAADTAKRESNKVINFMIFSGDSKRVSLYLS